MINRAASYIINASAHEIPLPSGMFHTVCTSPPYFSLRRYQGAQDVEWPEVEYSPMPGLPPLTIPAMTAPLGLEPTPESYIGHLVLCFREVARVMRPDGVAWVVMGDSFTSGGRQGHGTRIGYKQQTNRGMDGVHDPPRLDGGMDDGNLMLIPHRLALALQADGWTCRNDVVWQKKSPMPESVAGWAWQKHRIKLEPGRPPAVQEHLPDNGRRPGGNRGNQWGDVQNQPNATWTDCPGCPKCSATGGYVLRRGSWRHTRAHETVLMLTRGMGYFSDQQRVREATADYDRKGGTATWECDGMTTHGVGSDSLHQMSKSGRNPRSVLQADELDELWAMFLAWLDDGNPPDVFSPSPESYSGPHYAVYPRTLISPLLRATAPPRVCPECGAPWAPVVERPDFSQQPKRKMAKLEGHMLAKGPDYMTSAGQAWQDWRDANPDQILGHRPTCGCGYPGLEPGQSPEPVPGWCLDMFCGTGTTLEVCAELGVSAVGLDISGEYLDWHAKPRIGLTPARALETLPMFQDL